MYYLVYGLLFLVSLLPMRVLYGLADIIYVFVYYVFGYRKEVVMSNLGIVFPEKPIKDRVIIAKKFYQNFIDAFIESLKMITASDSFLKKRFTANWSTIEELYETGRSCQIHLGHTFNWEWGNYVLSLNTGYKVLVVYMPIRNVIFEKLFYKLRTRSGSAMLPATNMARAIVPYRNVQYLLGLVADQTPGNSENAYWLNFFGRPTPFVNGPEKGARAGNFPVVYAYIEKRKRGHYHAVVEVATEEPNSLPEGELTRQYVKYLEGVIRKNPDMWLWTHRRWKKEWKEEFINLWIDTLPPPGGNILQELRSKNITTTEL